MQTRPPKCANVYAGPFYENVNAFLCRAFKQIRSQNEYKVQNVLFYSKHLVSLYHF